MYPFGQQRNSYGLDTKDDEILVEVNKGASLEEIAEKTDLSVNGVKYRMGPLIDKGLMEYTPKLARARTLTDTGKQYLSANGLLPTTGIFSE